jgi:site-specific recombinase XerC
MMKSGPNFSDVNRIAELANEGYNAEAISNTLSIRLSAVEAWIPDLIKQGRITADPDKGFEDPDAHTVDGEPDLPEDEDGDPE